MSKRRKADFELPSAEGEAGYPSDMVPMSDHVEVQTADIEAVHRALLKKKNVDGCYYIPANEICALADAFAEPGEQG